MLYAICAPPFLFVFLAKDLASLEFGWLFNGYQVKITNRYAKRQLTKVGSCQKADNAYFKRFWKGGKIEQVPEA